MQMTQEYYLKMIVPWKETENNFMKLILGNHLNDLTLFNFIFFWFNVKVQLESVQIQENM